MSFFVPRKDLRSIILDILKRGDRSISSITRELEAGGHKYHRLTVTGYLKAMADMGLVREREIPPSKVYSLAPHKRRDLYGALGDNARSLNLGYKKESRLCLQVLETLFGRPVFQSELERCGYDEPSGVKRITGEERSEAKEVVTKAGLRIGPRERAYRYKGNLMEEAQAMIVNMLIDISGASALRKGTKQSTLSLN